jgi:hypothetical protein
MIPLMLTIISLIIIWATKKEEAKYSLLLGVAAMIILYIPIINIFHMAFSIGALPFIFGVVIVMKSLLVPIINKIID